MTAPSGDSYKRIASNRKARHDYFIIESFEAGVELRGTEVKSIRTGQVSLTGAHARVEDGDVLLCGVNIPPYEHGNRFNHPPDRPRRLLLHRREIRKLQVHLEQKGHALVPLGVYLKRGLVKIELGLCRGKQQRDKRETLRRKTAEREAARDRANYSFTRST